MGRRKKAPKKPHPKKGKQQTRYDWAQIRIAREVQGKSFADLAKEFGAHHTTISAHAKKEQWRDPTDVRAKSAASAADKLCSDFIDQEGPAIRESLTQKHRIARRLLNLAEGHVTRLEKGIELILDTGKALVAEDPLQALRRLGLVLQNVEVVDRSLAGLKESGWRSDAGGGGKDSDTSEDEIQQALDSLSGDREGPAHP